jgi:hypothetical protein
MRGRMNSPNFALSVTAPKHNVSECPATALPVHATPVALPDVRKATGDRKSTNTDESSAIFVEFIHESAATYKADQPDTVRTCRPVELSVGAKAEDIYSR